MMSLTNKQACPGMAANNIYWPVGTVPDGADRTFNPALEMCSLCRHARVMKSRGDLFMVRCDFAISDENHYSYFDAIMKVLTGTTSREVYEAKRQEATEQTERELTKDDDIDEPTKNPYD